RGTVCVRSEQSPFWGFRLLSCFLTDSRAEQLIVLRSQSRREQCAGLPVQTLHARAAGPTRYVDSSVSAGSVWKHLWRQFILCSAWGNTKLRRSELPAE